MVIYKITNIVNGKTYIGKTSKKPINRFKTHIRNAVSYNMDTYLYKSIRKYGPENFRIDVILSVIDADYINDMEIECILSNSPEYNMTTGGEGGDTSYSLRYKASMKKYHASKSKESYATNGFEGKTHTDETKDLQSKKRLLYWETITEDEYAKRVDNFKGENNPMYGKTPKNAKRIRFNGTVYNSLVHAKRETGYSIVYLKKHGELLND